MGWRERNTDPTFQTLVTDICVFAYGGRSGAVFAAPSSVFLFYILAFLLFVLIMKIERNIHQ